MDDPNLKLIPVGHNCICLPARICPEHLYDEGRRIPTLWEVKWSDVEYHTLDNAVIVKRYDRSVVMKCLDLGLYVAWVKQLDQGLEIRKTDESKITAVLKNNSRIALYDLAFMTEITENRLLQLIQTLDLYMDVEGYVYSNPIKTDAS